MKLVEGSLHKLKQTKGKWITHAQKANIHSFTGSCKNRSIPSCYEPPYKSEAKCKAFQMEISFVCT